MRDYKNLLEVKPLPNDPRAKISLPSWCLVLLYSGLEGGGAYGPASTVTLTFL